MGSDIREAAVPLCPWKSGTQVKDMGHECYPSRAAQLHKGELNGKSSLES